MMKHLHRQLIVNAIENTIFVLWIIPQGPKLHARRMWNFHALRGRLIYEVLILDSLTPPFAPISDVQEITLKDNGLKKWKQRAVGTSLIASALRDK